MMERGKWDPIFLSGLRKWPQASRRNVMRGPGTEIDILGSWSVVSVDLVVAEPGPHHPLLLGPTGVREMPKD